MDAYFVIWPGGKEALSNPLPGKGEVGSPHLISEPGVGLWVSSAQGGGMFETVFLFSLECLSVFVCTYSHIAFCPPVQIAFWVLKWVIYRPDPWGLY